MSLNLAPLHARLSELQCVHPIGTHKSPVATVQNSNGDWSTRASQIWSPELCRTIAPFLAEHTHIGGLHIQLGRDSPSVLFLAAYETFVDVLDAASTPELHACFMAGTTSGVPITVEGSSEWIVPQSNSALEACPQRAFWESVAHHSVCALMLILPAMIYAGWSPHSQSHNLHTDLYRYGRRIPHSAI